MHLLFCFFLWGVIRVGECALRESIPDAWTWEYHNASAYGFSPSPDTVLYPTLAYRPVQEDFILAFGFRENLPYNSTVAANTGVYVLPADNDDVYQTWRPLSTTANYSTGRAYSQGIYDPKTNRLLQYGGVECLEATLVNGVLVWPRCTISLPLGPNTSWPFRFTDTTRVLTLHDNGVSVWSEYTIEDQIDKSQYPPSCGVCVSAFDSTTHSMLLWAFWTSPNVSNPRLPLYRLDLATMQWHVLPLSPINTVWPRASSWFDASQMLVDSQTGNVILYIPSAPQILVYNAAAQVWTEPAEAARTAPDMKVWVAMAFHPPSHSLISHGGYFVATVRSNLYVLDLDTFIWSMPYSAQPASPSRQKHSLCYDPIRDRMVLWGGMRHDTTDQIYPTETYFLNVPALTPVQLEIWSCLLARTILGAAYLVFVVMTILTLCYDSCLKRGSNTHTLGVLTPLLGTGEVVGHISIMLACIGTGALVPFWVQFALFLIAISANTLMVFRHMQIISPSNPQCDKKYAQYKKDCPKTFYCAAGAACLHFSWLQVTYSHLLGLPQFSAAMRMNDIYRDAMSDYMRRRALVTALAQDIPSAILQLYLAIFWLDAAVELKITLVAVLCITFPNVLMSLMSAMYGFYAARYSHSYYWEPLSDARIMPLATPGPGPVPAHQDFAVSRRQQLLDVQTKYGQSTDGSSDSEGGEGPSRLGTTRFERSSGSEGKGARIEVDTDVRPMPAKDDGDAPQTVNRSAEPVAAATTKMSPPEAGEIAVFQRVSALFRRPNASDQGELVADRVVKTIFAGAGLVGTESVMEDRAFPGLRRAAPTRSVQLPGMVVPGDSNA